MRDMKMRDQIAGVENAGKVSMESQSVKKCLKVVVLSVVLSIVLHWLYIDVSAVNVGFCVSALSIGLWLRQKNYYELKTVLTSDGI